MRDLYRRLGLSTCVSDRTTIERAIANTQPQDPRSAIDAREVLLVPERKAVYDRTRSTLVRIGQLRANLGLSEARHWTAYGCSDFNAPPSTSGSQLRAFQSKYRMRSRKRAGSTLGQWIGAGLVAFALCGCLAGIVIQAVSPNSYSASGSRTPASIEPGSRSTPRSMDASGATPPNRTRAELVREMVTQRILRSNASIEPGDIDTLVTKLLDRRPDPLPTTGVLYRMAGVVGVAPLEVKTRAGSNYFVKVVDWTTKATVLTAFIRGGEHFETLLPLGSYEIRYASGQAWYGDVIDFGETSTYARCDEKFDFTKSLQGYSGFIVELILQQRGNLETVPISPSDF